MKMVLRHSKWFCAVGFFLVLCPRGPCLAQEGDDADKEKKEEKKEGLPLKPVRKVEFQTDEGTWMSLDVSPRATAGQSSSSCLATCTPCPSKAAKPSS